MLASRSSTFVLKRFVSAAPPTTTGIEHALKSKQVGKSHKQDFKDYKCIDYLNYNKYSFYDFEVCLFLVFFKVSYMKSSEQHQSISRSSTIEQETGYHASVQAIGDF